MLSRSIRTEITIAASPADVWAVLAEVSEWSEWNPLLAARTRVPPLEEGATLELLVTPPGYSKGSTIKPTLMKVEPHKELRWMGRAGSGWLFQGEHYYLLEETGEGHTRFTHGEDFWGLLVPILRGLLDATEQGFNEMNKALKWRCEEGTQRQR